MRKIEFLNVININFIRDKIHIDLAISKPLATPPPFLTVSYYLYIQNFFSTNDANVAPHIGFNLSFFVKLFGGWVWLKF